MDGMNQRDNLKLLSTVHVGSLSGSGKENLSMFDRTREYRSAASMEVEPEHVLGAALGGLGKRGREG